MNDAKIHFRDATLSDLPQIVALLADDTLGQTREDTSLPLDSKYTNAFWAIEEDPNQRLIVVVEHDQIIGTLQLSFIPGIARTGMWRGQIEAVRIAQTHQGARLGEKLMYWAIEKCKERDCGLVQLTTDATRTKAHNFYEKLGFVASHVGYKLFL